MVKRQKEKQYQSAREHREISQLRSGSSQKGSKVQRRLPFQCCALTLIPFEDPVCTANGIVFENMALLPFLLKHKIDPVTGKSMTSRDVIKLHMDKDEEGRWQCPIMTKPFSDHTKVVAIRHGNEANVYSWQAYQELNLRTKNMEDLISGEKFTRKDVMILNDPENEELNRLRDINHFYHVLNARSLDTSKPTTNVNHSITATRIMEKLQQRQKENHQKPMAANDHKTPRIFSDAVTGVAMTSGKTSGSLTSTALDVSSSNETREATQEEILTSRFAVMRKRKRKGYVTLTTNMGDLGLELHCDIAPRTCTNFLGLAAAGKYDGSVFHRLIPNFMIQGGKDPKHDESLWGGSFVDEFDDRLKHQGEGIVSMANAGQHTNKRQFFITFGDAPHLDRKHSIFGRVVEGTSVLHEMRKVPTNSKDRPVHEIKIEKIHVLVDPAEDAEKIEKQRIEEEMETKRQREHDKKASALGKKRKASTIISPASTSLVTSKKNPLESLVVGKYLPKGASSKKFSSDSSSALVSAEDSEVVNTPKPTRLPSPPKKTKFGDFSGW